MAFNLLRDPFFPVVTRTGKRRWLAFADLAALSSDDPSVDFDWPRADFNIAAYEFAIGIATLAFQPVKPSDWTKLWKNPPGPGEVRDKIAPFVHAFDLDGDGPRFMQELGGLDGETNPIETLLIDTPGANGQKKNADVLTHRERYPALSLPAAAIALYALQQFAPSGGAGNRTSMRGGGPLTTLVLPGSLDGQRPALWRTILANLVVSDGNEWDVDDLPKILPWLAPTIVSDKAHGERVVNEAEENLGHTLQAFFGMPRRVALRFGPEGVCSMTGEHGPVVSEWVQKPWGINYGLWKHPLTPYRRQKEAEPPYSVKPKSNRFGYRDWVAVTVGEKKQALAAPAPAIFAARDTRREVLRLNGNDARLRAAGWAMNNMEAVAYLTAEQPLHLAITQEAQQAVDATATRFARAADIIAAALIRALRDALFSEGAKPSTDKALFDGARGAFYETTEDAFHRTLDGITKSEGLSEERLSRAWLKDMSRAAREIFDTTAPVPVDEPERAGRIAEAFGWLRGSLTGYGPQGKALFDALGLSPPQPKPQKKKGVDGG